MSNGVTFLAILPDIQSAITMSGGRGNGSRIKLELPESEADAALLLAHHGRGRLLKVTVEFSDEDESTDKENTAPARTEKAPARIDLRRSVDTPRHK